MLSGLTFKSSLYGSFTALWNIVKKRFAQLLLPFFVWTMIRSLLFGGLNAFFDAILYPGHGLWFLWDLFFIYVSVAVASFIALKYKTNIYLCIGCIFVIWLVIGALSNGLFDFTRCGRLYLFFVIGFMCKNHRIRCMGGLLMLAYLILAYYWYPNRTSISGIDSAFINRIISSLPYRLIVSLCGCLAFLYVGQLTEKIFASTILNRIGGRTLGIYVIHLTIIQFGASLFSTYNFYMTILLYTTLFVLISDGVVLLLERSKYTSFFMLGQKR